MTLDLVKASEIVPGDWIATDLREFAPVHTVDPCDDGRIEFRMVDSARRIVVIVIQAGAVILRGRDET